ncbi:MAG: hypothetical protein ACOYJJ_07080 [Anaerovoracaceae bacterium]
MSRSKSEVEKQEERRPTTSDAAKAALAVIGIGLVAGVSLVVTMDRFAKKVFVNGDWPDEEWSSDDWAEEELDN